jgi:hypothetical protein
MLPPLNRITDGLCSDVTQQGRSGRNGWSPLLLLKLTVVITQHRCLSCTCLGLEAAEEERRRQVEGQLVEMVGEQRVGQGRAGGARILVVDHSRLPTL